mmetsp:Transcript_24087/g.29240  ORF Transcript_24087/g.29240 Transcript_24087/m.29240 type:complete len:170 (-) Transcript_24087:347-856(-)
MLMHLGFVWEQRYFELKDYNEKNGNCNVTSSFLENQELADWTAAQRDDYKAIEGSVKLEHPAVLTPEALTNKRMDKLKSLGFDFDFGRARTTAIKIRGTSRQNVVWETHLEELKKLREEKGNCLVPCRYRDNPKLGIWVKTQRYQYQHLIQGKKWTLNEDRTRVLEEIG